MQTMKCPHCDRTIELVEPKDLKEQYEMTPNKVVHARKLGAFPEPALQFENRTIWLKEDIDSWVAGKDDEEFNESLRYMTEVMKKRNLSPENRKKILALLGTD